MKSPLRYPGGKTKAVKYILDHIPKNTKTVYSPFLGGGSVEIAMVQTRGIKVCAYDRFDLLVEFWQCLLKDSQKMAQIVRDSYYPLKKERYYHLRKTIRDHTDMWERAAIFYALNRSSFSGTFSGGFSPKTDRFTEGHIEYLKNFKMNGNLLSVELKDFKDSIIRDNFKYLLFCDPPYYLNQKLYGMDNNMDFDHEHLAEILYGRDNWLLCYNDHPKIRKMYRDFRIYRPQWAYGMSKDKKSRELFIISNDIQVPRQTKLDKQA